MSPRRTPHMFALAIVTIALPLVAHAATRPHSFPGLTRIAPHTAASVVQVQQANLAQVLQCLMGPSVQVSNAVLTGAADAVGLFTGGTTVFGIDQGVVLSTGNITSIVGPNLANDTSTDNGMPGDADLEALIPGYVTYDAVVLEFDFTCSNPTAISFQYVFGSEEYNEWVNTPYNDVFGFFLNGVDIAKTPPACSAPGLPVAVNNVNCNNPYAPPGGLNCDCYRNNALPDGGGSLDTEMDGLTQVFYATGTIRPGLNHMKIALADAGDGIYDSNVMLHCQSFSCSAPPSVGGCCVGSECYLLGAAQCADEGGVYGGDGTACFPNPCNPTPVHHSTWGQLKSRYR